MLLYENAWPSNYEEIKTWSPVWYREVLEMDGLWQTWGKQLDGIQSGVIRVVDNNFIATADVQTIGKIETFLGISYDSPRTLIERKNVVSAFFLGQGHIGQREIKELISVFTDGEISVSLVGGAIQITVTRDFADNFNLYDCHLVLDSRIPTHLAIDLIDNALPVSAFNDNKFIFRDLRIAFAFNTAMQESFCQKAVSFMGHKVKQAFDLTGSVLMDSHGSLDGSFILDGSKNLNQIFLKEAL